MACEKICRVSSDPLGTLFLIGTDLEEFPYSTNFMIKQGEDMGDDEKFLEKICSKT